METELLIDQAEKAKAFASAPYSGFAVGAALLCGDGTVVTGCNIENASLGLTNCAERTAVFKAVSEGKRSFTALAVISDSPDITVPCGACRQVLTEFCDPSFRIIMCNRDKEYEETTLGALFPLAFKLIK